MKNITAIKHFKAKFCSQTKVADKKGRVKSLITCWPMDMDVVPKQN